MRLDEIKNGNIVRILNLEAKGALLHKLLDMGFVDGTCIEIIREAPLYDPMQLKIHNYNITLRKSEAKLIKVEMI